jgi:prolyl 4-hydroxylase
LEGTHYSTSAATSSFHVASFGSHYFFIHFQKNSPSAASIGRPESHTAAAIGDIESLKELVVKDRRALLAKDHNGWQPIHEAVRGGHIDAVELLVKHGADINSVTNHGNGVSPYNIALHSLSADHPVAQYLSGLGAVDVGPEL